MENDEVPVGAVIVCNNKIIARGYNQTELLNDVTAHAEIIAITAAANYLGAKYLTDCTIYVTLEPCIMCAGALSWSQISNVVFGAYDEKRGFTKFSENILHPKTTLTGGIMEDSPPQIPMMKYIGTSIASQNTKNVIRSRARKMPMIAPSRKRNQKVYAFTP